MGRMALPAGEGRRESPLVVNHEGGKEIGTNNNNCVAKLDVAQEMKGS